MWEFAEAIARPRRGGRGARHAGRLRQRLALQRDLRPRDLPDADDRGGRAARRRGSATRCRTSDAEALAIVLLGETPRGARRQRVARAAARARGRACRRASISRTSAASSGLLAAASRAGCVAQRARRRATAASRWRSPSAASAGRGRAHRRQRRARRRDPARRAALRRVDRPRAGRDRATPMRCWNARGAAECPGAAHRRRRAARACVIRARRRRAVDRRGAGRASKRSGRARFRADWSSADASSARELVGREAAGKLAAAREADRFHDECGVFGVHGHAEAAQHHLPRALRAPAPRPGERGHRDLERRASTTCTARWAWSPTSSPRRSCASSRAVTRSGTSATRRPAESSLRNAQPFCATTDGGPVAIAHNGNLVNAGAIRRELEGRGAIFSLDVRLAR